jgi:hypothetical protein
MGGVDLSASRSAGPSPRALGLPSTCGFDQHPGLGLRWASAERLMQGSFEVAVRPMLSMLDATGRRPSQHVRGQAERRPFRGRLSGAVIPPQRARGPRAIGPIRGPLLSLRFGPVADGPNAEGARRGGVDATRELVTLPGEGRVGRQIRLYVGRDGGWRERTRRLECDG